MSSASIRRPPRSRPPAVMPRRPARRLAYRAATVEELAAEPRRFDVVSAMEVIEHAADPKALRRLRRLARQARRPLPRLDPEPHAEELRPRHRRGRIRAALARAGNAPLGAVRDADRAHRLRARRGLEAGEPARGRLRSARRGLAAVGATRASTTCSRRESRTVEPGLLTSPGIPSAAGPAPGRSRSANRCRSIGGL